MENKLINLSLLNGKYPLSKKTKKNLDLYLKSKYQIAGSGSGSEDGSGPVDVEEKGTIKALQDWVAWGQSFVTGVDVSDLDKKLVELGGILNSINQDITRLKDSDLQALRENVSLLIGSMAQIQTKNDNLEKVAFEQMIKTEQLRGDTQQLKEDTQQLKEETTENINSINDKLKSLDQE